MEGILQRENKILRNKSEEVPVESIKTRKIEVIIKMMRKALDSQEDGVAIAAPQIGENLRIFVVSKRIFEIMEEEKSKSRSKRENLESFEKEGLDYTDMVFINPVILKQSKKKSLVEEGCLSVRWLYGKVERYEKTLVRAYDENGQIFTMGGSGLMSQVFQHEIDHLDGVLFIDKAKNLKEVPPKS
jgi:peptide deformylase